MKPIAPCAEGYAQIKTILHSAAKQASQDSGDDMETGEPPQDNMDTTDNDAEQEPPGDSTKDEGNKTPIRGNGNTSKGNGNNPSKHIARSIAVPEDREVRTFGVLFCNTGIPATLINFAVQYVLAIDAATIYNHKNEVSHGHTKDSFIAALKDPETGPAFINNFIGLKRDGQKDGDGSMINRDYGAVYISSAYTYGECKTAFVASIGGTQVMDDKNWFLNYHSSPEVMQKLVGFCQAKNPAKTYGKGIVEEIVAVLQKQHPDTTFDLSWKKYNEKLQDGTKVQVLGLQTGTAGHSALVKIMKQHKDFNGISVRYK